jgi:hypothetical protein
LPLQLKRRLLDGTMSNRERAAALLAIKIAPPRTRRWTVSRERLVRRFHSVRECALICVQAPAGYGKTSLLARMRREWLATGACAAWLSLDADDEAGRFVEALLCSTYSALGRPAPLAAASQALRSGVEPPEALVTLLGELAEAATPVAIVLDDAHLLPPEVASELLPYLALNLPPNVHLILGTRRRLPFATSDLLAHGQFASFDAADPPLPWTRPGRFCKRDAAIGSTPTRSRGCTSAWKDGRWGCSSCSSMLRTRRTRSAHCAASLPPAPDSTSSSPTRSCSGSTLRTSRSSR